MILHEADIFSFLPQFLAEVFKVEVILNHSALLMNKQKINGQSVNEVVNTTSKREQPLDEQNILYFSTFIQNLNKLLLQQWNVSKIMFTDF